MRQSKKVIGGAVLVSLIVLLALPSFVASAAFITLLIAAFSWYTLQPKPQPIRVKSNNRRN